MMCTPSGTTVFVHGLAVRAYVGIGALERQAVQTILIDLDIRLGNPCIMQDRMDASINYKTIADMIEELCATERMRLIETLAERIARRIFEDTRAAEVTIRITKPRKLPHAEAVGVCRTFSNVEVPDARY